MELMASPEIATLYFYPRPPRGGRRQNELLADVQLVFLSTPSARRATQQIKTFYRDGNDFYPRPPRGGRRKDTNLFWRLLYFYPRPPRGGRLYRLGYLACIHGISIHALREEGDDTAAASIVDGKLFLSTPSARRATAKKQIRYQQLPAISIHALREEGDAGASAGEAAASAFLSTPSARRATLWRSGACPGRTISIHALREEGDRVDVHQAVLLGYFYPRPPRGGRPPVVAALEILLTISIHALREEGDRYERSPVFWVSNFYPRPPRGGRPRQGVYDVAAAVFLSTPSARRATAGL